MRFCRGGGERRAGEEELGKRVARLVLEGRRQAGQHAGDAVGVAEAGFVGLELQELGYFGHGRGREKFQRCGRHGGS